MTNYRLHEVSGPCLPDDSTRVLPLIGNDQLKLCVDARGAMHDFDARPSYPPPRIVWTGRRHNLSLNRYSSNLFEWGMLNVELHDEAVLPPVTAWRQRLCPRQGLVQTEIRRGAMVERATSFVHLDKNVIVFHRRYESLPAAAVRSCRATFTFCHVGTDEIPYRTTFAPLGAWTDGIAADTTADGLCLTRGRIALLSDRPCTARARANRLELDIPLAEDGSVTVYLTLVDDLPPGQPLLDIADGAWMSDAVREVNLENRKHAAQAQRPDPIATTAQLRDWIGSAGYHGVLESHHGAWKRFWDQARITLPKDQPTLSAVLETQLYLLRCVASDWSFPANPFNSSWGAAYFWDERYQLEGLMALGMVEFPRRVLEWRRRVLPFATLMTAGRGARFVSSANEAGAHMADRNGTNFYEFPLVGVIANYVWQYLRYTDDPAMRRRYYPIVRECAEFYRNWLLVELPGNHVTVVPSIDIDEGRYPVLDGPAMVCGAARTMHLAVSLAGELGLDADIAPHWQRLGQMAASLARNGINTALDSDGPLTPGPLFFSDLEIHDLPASSMWQDPAVQAWREQYLRQHQPPALLENCTGETGPLPLWSWANLSNAYLQASRNRPDQAERELQLSLRTMLDFGSLNESATPDLNEVHHPWFATGAGAMVRAVTRMLLCPRDQEVWILPGVPASWRDLAFELPAHGGVLVTLALAAGVLTRVRLSACDGKTRSGTVHLPRRFLPAGWQPPASCIVRGTSDQTLSLEVEIGSGVELV